MPLPLPLSYRACAKKPSTSETQKVLSERDRKRVRRTEARTLEGLFSICTAFANFTFRKRVEGEKITDARADESFRNDDVKLARLLLMKPSRTLRQRVKLFDHDKRMVQTVVEC